MVSAWLINAHVFHFKSLEEFWEDKNRYLVEKSFMFKISCWTSSLLRAILLLHKKNSGWVDSSLKIDRFNETSWTCTNEGPVSGIQLVPKNWSTQFPVKLSHCANLWTYIFSGAKLWSHTCPLAWRSFKQDRQGQASQRLAPLNG